MKNLNLQSLIIIAVLALITIMWGIGSVPLFDPDEPVYAVTASRHAILCTPVILLKPPLKP